jgi:hypothetical protein
MARPVKWILWIAGILIGLFVLLSVLAAIFLPPILKDALEKQLARVTGGQVTVQSVSAFPPGSASATGITVAGTRWPSIQNFAINRLEVGYNPFGLLSAHPEDAITTIRLLGFRVEAVQKRVGGQRPPAVVPAAAVGQPASQPPASPGTMMAASAAPIAVNQPTAPPAQSQPQPAQVPVTSGNSRINIELAGGALNLDGREVATEIHGEMVLTDFDRLEGKLLARALGGDADNLTVKGSRVFSTNSGAVELTGDHLPLGPLLELTFLRDRVTGLGGSISIQAALQDAQGKPDLYSINLTLHQGLIAVMGIRSQIAEINGNASLGPASATLKELEVKVGQWKVPFKVSGTLENFQNPVVDLRCTTEKINLSDVTSLFNLENRNLLQGLALELVGVGKLVCTIKGPISHPDVSLRIESVNVAGYNIPTNIGKKGSRIQIRIPRKR